MSIEKQIAELKAQNEDNAKRIAELENQLKKKGPVVPWVGAMCLNTYSNSKYWWDDTCKVSEYTKIIDSPLHPQFMPNDGVNPWPDDMEVQIIGEASGWTYSGRAGKFNWEKKKGDTMNIAGSRPACGWAEYLKETGNE